MAATSPFPERRHVDLSTKDAAHLDQYAADLGTTPAWIILCALAACDVVGDGATPPDGRVRRVIALKPEEAQWLDEIVADTEASGTISWFIRCACAQSGLFGRDFDPDLRLRVDDDLDDA